MNRIWHTDVVQLSTTGSLFLASKVGGFEDNAGFSVYVWCDANFRVGVNGTGSGITTGATLTANKWHCVGNVPNAVKMYFASTTGTPDMRIMVTEGHLHGV